MPRYQLVLTIDLTDEEVAVSGDPLDAAEFRMATLGVGSLMKPMDGVSASVIATKPRRPTCAMPEFGYQSCNHGQESHGNRRGQMGPNPGHGKGDAGDGCFHKETDRRGSRSALSSCCVHDHVPLFSSPTASYQEEVVP